MADGLKFAGLLCGYKVKGKRTVSVIITVLGIISLAISTNIQGKYATIIGVSLCFVFLGLSLFLLIKNFTGMVSSEMAEIVEKMHNDADFFSTIISSETSQTLEERFVKAGFSPYQDICTKGSFRLQRTTSITMLRLPKKKTS